MIDQAVPFFTGIGISAISLASIMKFNNKNGHSYVRKNECHNAQKSIRDSILALERHIDKRMDSLENIILKS